MGRLEPALGPFLGEILAQRRRPPGPDDSRSDDTVDNAALRLIYTGPMLSQGRSNCGRGNADFSRDSGHRCRRELNLPGCGLDLCHLHRPPEDDLGGLW